jgi:hypothetical protein
LGGGQRSRGEVEQSRGGAKKGGGGAELYRT